MPADLSGRGNPWTDDELDLIVADYFAMLAEELTGRAYIKAHHNAAIMAATGRSHRSVEFKHQNISAVLDELGLPWIVGYMPKRNYQNAIFDAIDRYLSAHGGIASAESPGLRESSAARMIFVDPPGRRTEAALPGRLNRLIRKFDPARRDAQDRALGHAGESFVMDVERKRLLAHHRPDLSRRLRWVAAEDGDGAGYDIHSFDLAGRDQLIEVKTTNGSARPPFFLTRTECDVAAERPEAYRIYRVHLFAQAPRIFTIAPPLSEVLNLRAETWRASFG